MSASNGNGKAVPAAYPPPVDSPNEFVKRGLDAEDELIEGGVAIVGGGTAGLAGADRPVQPPRRRGVASRNEFAKRGLAAGDELIEVGGAIVGGGTAGLACANRLLQLL